MFDWEIIAKDYTTTAVLVDTILLDLLLRSQSYEEPFVTEKDHRATPIFNTINPNGVWSKDD